MPGGSLSADDVRRVAKLARLAPSDEQVEAYRRQLSAVLGYMNRLRELDLAGVEPLAHVGAAVNRLDDDVPGPTLLTESLLKMAPRSWKGFIRVPKVLEEGGGA